MRPALAALAVIAILGVSAAPGAFSLQQGSSPNSGSGPQWWNSEYAYRQNLTMTNPSAAPLSNYPVFVPVSFPFSHISDATAQLRLIDRNDAEVPSYVLDEVSSEGFVTSAWLLAFVSIPSSSSATYELYYGSPNATAPAYRTDSVVAQAQAGELSLDVSGSQPTTASFQVALGGTYSEQILSRVSYGTGGLETYGAAGIAQSPAPVVSPLSLLANISTSINVLSSVYSAGVLRYTQAYVLDNGTLIVAVLLSNTGDSPVAGVGLTDVVDATSLAALGALSTSYSKSGLLSTAVSGAYFGYDSNQAASSFEVGDLPQVVSDVSGGTLSNASSGAGTATALSWGMGTLAPGASAQSISAWGAGSTPGALAGSLAAYIDQPQIVMGQEQTYSTTPSQVTSAWNVAIPIPNASVSGGGLSVPVALDGAVPVSSSIRLGGTASYTLPTGDASLSGQKGWVPETSATGNASAYATTAFYSIQQQSFTDSVRVSSVNGTGSGAAQLVSPVMSFPDSVSKSLVVNYRAFFSGSGDLSSQWLYVAVDTGQSLTGPFSQTLVVPAVGSSTSIDGSGCQSLSSQNSPASPSNPIVTTSGALVADGSWRSLNLSLDSAFGTSSVYARIRFCAATVAGFAGQLEIDVSSAGVEAKGAAAGFLSASISPAGSAVALSFIPGATFEPSSLTLDGLVNFTVLQSAPLVWNGGTSYDGTIQGLLLPGPPDPPTSSAQNETSATPVPSATLVGATISSQLYPLTPEVMVNGTAVVAQTVGNALFLNSSTIENGGASTLRAADLALTFPGNELWINVDEANGVPLPGAGVTVQVNGSSPVNESVTNAGGWLSLLVPSSTYNIAVDFQGVGVATTTTTVTSNENLTVPTTVYPITMQVKDALGGPVAGADIAVASGSSNWNLASGPSGMTSFLGVPGKQYNVTVSISDAVYYVGTVAGSTSRATFELGTSYLPTSIQVGIVGAVAATMIGASLVVYFSRMRPKVDKTPVTGSPSET